MNNESRFNILVVRTDRIGDVVLSLPVAAAIKSKYPNCKLSFLVREYTKPIVEANKFIDEIIVIKERNGKFKLFENVELIKKHNIDVVIVLYPTFIVSLIMFLAGIKKRVGTGYRLYPFLFTDKVYEHRKDAKKHEIEYNFGLLKPLGIDFNPGIENVKFNLNLSGSLLKKVEKILDEHNISSDKGFIILHPGSGGSAVDLPIEKFKELITLLTENDVNIVLTGSKSEKHMNDKLVVNKNVFNFAGLFNLEELMALISKANLLVANSTGPIHIAAALGIQTFGFYPKIKSCSAERWGPYSNKKKIYQPELDCQDCTREQCEKLNCMSYININKVFNDIKNFLENISEKKNVN